MIRTVMLGLALALALGLALPAPGRAQTPLAAEGCLGCHGPGGGGMAAVPGIAGRPAGELAAALAAFRADTRPATIMGRIMRGYTTDEIAALAAHYASLPPGGPR